MSNSHLSESDLRHRERSEPQSSEASGTGCAVRITWLVVGPAAVTVTAAVLARNQGSGVVGLSIIYWGSVLAMLLLRYVDVVKLDGMTADGEPASRAQLRRYCAGVVLVAAALYVLVLVLRH